jgi:DNA-binding CsgD family transcriptional regulator
LIERLLDDARSGQSQVLVVCGEAGIGKSALLEHAASAAATREMRVVRASGVESEMELAFAGLHLLCAPMVDHMAQLPEPQRESMSVAFGLATGQRPETLLIALALLSLLGDVADETPLLCVVDDAHWLDHASAHALAFAARRLVADRVCLLFGVRDVTDDLRGLPELALRGLDAVDAGVLLASALPGPLDQRVRDRVIAETRGNPLALLELPSGLSAAELAGGFGLLTTLPMAGQLEESFRRRLADLEPATQRFLTVAAAEPTGDAALVWRAGAQLGLSGDDLSPAIEGGLVEVGAAVRFRHPSVRSATYGAASITDRRDAHRALAEVTDMVADPDRRAWHLALATSGPDPDVADELGRCAARAQSRGGVAAAAAMRERSAALTLDPELRLRRTIEAARAHVEAGAYRAAAALLAVAEAGRLDEQTRAEIEVIRAISAYSYGNSGDATDLVYRAARRLERVDPRLARPIYLNTMSMAVSASDLSREIDVQQAARAILNAPPPDEERPRDLLVEALATNTTDGAAAAAPLLRRALSAFRDQPSPEDGWSYGVQCAAASILWELETYVASATQQVEAARASGALRMLPNALHTLAIADTFAGRLSNAAALLGEAEAINDATGNTVVMYAMAKLAAWRGHEAEAIPVIDAVVERGYTQGQGLAVKTAQSARATLFNSVGRYEEALAAARDASRPPADWGTHLTLHELVEAAVRSGQPDAASEAMDHLSESAQASGTDWALGIEARSRALLAEGDAAELLYLDAIERLDRSPVRSEAARVHLLYGEWLRRANRRIDARQHLRIAFEEFGAMGIDAFADRAGRELVATGETVRKRTVDTAQELTPQELQIARLAAAGGTNREIGAQLYISVRTVEWHLRKVFVKLDLSNRRELSAGLTAMGHLTTSA